MFRMKEHEIWMDPFPGKVLAFLTVDPKIIIEWKRALFWFSAYNPRFRSLLVFSSKAMKDKASTCGGNTMGKWRKNYRLGFRKDVEANLGKTYNPIR